ncbi:MAG: hypothetical protein J6B74_07220 [Ruminococcus sp.]|nr:hypothetical protein [Ruminococcus sp.]
MYEQEIATLHEKRKKTLWIRDEIEDIVKKENIDRNRFHEFSKSGYIDIIRKFYFVFSDRKNYTPSLIYLSLCYMHFRENLEQYYIDCFFRTYDWTEYMMTIKNVVPDKNLKLFLITDEGWVYEGYADEIFQIMNNTSCNYDFYIVSSKFDWFIAVSDIEDNATMYRK